MSTTALRSIYQARVLWFVSAAVCICAVISIPAFRTPVSLNSLLATLAPIVLIATGQALVVFFGGIDLSVGATAGLSTVILAASPVIPGGAPVALVLALGSGAAVGVLNGIGVTFGINPLLMTFAMAGIVQGVALLLQNISDASMPIELIETIGASFGSIPLPAVFAVGTMFAVWWWLSQSRSGRVVQAAGYDRRIAERLHLPVARTTLIVFGVSGTISALGGLAIASRTYTADALVGTGAVIDSIATVLVAGIVITGGVGSLASVLPAAVILAVVGQMITLTGTDSYYLTIFKGVLLIAAMGIYQLTGLKFRVPWRLAKTRAAVAEGANL